jgi:hypothetical protein
MTSLGIPSIFEGFHAKMSLLARRKSMSALSYLRECSANAYHLALRAIGVYEDVTAHLYEARPAYIW